MMSKPDCRTLTAKAQETLRQRVMRAVGDGMSQSEAARVFGVARQSVNRWARQVHEEGPQRLLARKRGRPVDTGRLQGWQAGTIVRLITDRHPEQLKLPFVLWTREAVRDLIAQRFGIRQSLSTVGRQLKRWGFTPQKPVRRAWERDPQAVETWLKREYPRIKRQAKREKAEIHWGDEMGMRSDHQTGRSYSPKGKTPVVAGTGQRFSCHMISAVTNRGTLRFMVYKKRFTTDVFLEFLRRLLRGAKRTIYLIVDGHPVHKSAAVRRWLAKHAARIRMFLLPSYSPELNPDELLNNDVKSNAIGRRRPATQHEMIRDVRGYLRGTQKRPDIVRGYFRQEHVRYAA
jgi:transposase